MSREMIAPNSVDAYLQGYNDGYRDAIQDMKEEGKLTNE